MAGFTIEALDPGRSDGDGCEAALPFGVTGGDPGRDGPADRMTSAASGPPHGIGDAVAVPGAPATRAVDPAAGLFHLADLDRMFGSLDKGVAGAAGATNGKGDPEASFLAEADGDALGGHRVGRLLDRAIAAAVLRVELRAPSGPGAAEEAASAAVLAGLLMPRTGGGGLFAG